MKALAKPPSLNGAAATVRVAIYTRKSTDEARDQEFGSLEAQRESVESYVASQRGEGWVALPERYDDGGFTGANTVRPAFQRLLKEVEARKVNLVAVYRIDRLSRSLLDFKRVMELFERHEVSFVSVTQPINTTTPAGRMVLNILATFAQFERETIAERTRDKMGATRRRGMWTGGPVLLGYDTRGEEAGGQRRRSRPGACGVPPLPGPGLGHGRRRGAEGARLDPE
jgi:site-specific DNA recombinase